MGGTFERTSGAQPRSEAFSLSRVSPRRSSVARATGGNSAVSAASSTFVLSGLAEQDLPPARCMQRPSAHMTRQGRTPSRMGAMPAATRQDQLSARPEMTVQVDKMKQTRPPPREEGKIVHNTVGGDGSVSS